MLDEQKRVCRLAMTIVLRNKKWHLKKDVPRRYASIEPRKVVWVSLHTDAKEKTDLQGALVWQEMLAAWDARLFAGKSIRFSDDLEARFFEELVSERRIVRYTQGQPTRAFERIPGRRAECLDAFTYSLAARVLINIDLDRREAELSSVATPQQNFPTVIKSRWLSR